MAGKVPAVDPYIAEVVYGAAERRRAFGTPAEPKVRMSAIGRCERSLSASLHGIPEDTSFSGQLLVLFDHGNAIEEHVIRQLKLSGFNITGTQDELVVDVAGYPLTGHIDGRIGEHTVRILEIKSANTNQFAQCLEKGYEKWKPVYGDQLQVYMGASGVHESLALVYCKDTSEIYCERVKFDPAAYATLLDKVERITKAKEPLPRPAEGKSQFCNFCKYCERNAWCWAPTTGVEFAE